MKELLNENSTLMIYASCVLTLIVSLLDALGNPASKSKVVHRFTIGTIVISSLVALGVTVVSEQEQKVLQANVATSKFLDSVQVVELTKVGVGLEQVKKDLLDLDTTKISKDKTDRALRAIIVVEKNLNVLIRSRGGDSMMRNNAIEYLKEKRLLNMREFLQDNDGAPSQNGASEKSQGTLDEILKALKRIEEKVDESNWTSVNLFNKQWVSFRQKA